MSLLPDSASFHERVQDCFVTYRGHGVSFSAVDLELVDRWAELEVPFEVVARGIRKAAEAALWDAPDEEGVGLRSLRSARKHVDTEISKYQRTTAGRTRTDAPVDEPFHVQRHKKLVAAVKKVTKPSIPAWLTRLPPPVDFDAADRQESLALLLLLRELPFERRRQLLREARTLVENAPSFSAATRRASLQFHRAVVARQAWNLPGLW
ncbi:MAG: hypothetical protein ACO1OB_07905 [Archangium sp.]